MSRILRGIRPADALVAGTLVALAAWLSLIQVGHGTGVVDGVRVDSDSAWEVPLWLVPPAAVLLWRRGPVQVALVSVAAVALHVVLFGWLVRCGSGLPLAFTLAFLVGAGTPTRRTAWLGFGAVMVLNALVLVEDSAAGPGITPFTAAIAAALFAVGRLVLGRNRLAVALAAHNAELRVLRDQRAALEVSDDRARLSRELDELLDRHLTELEATASSVDARRDPEAARAVLAGLEASSRGTLSHMRDVVGRLRGAVGSESLVLSPAPSVAHLDALLARHGGAQVRVQGDPRRLPATVELSAYRIVEHLLGALEDDPSVDVVMRFEDDALEVSVAGPVQRGTDVRTAVARARERARLQEGTLTVRVSRGRARAVALLPVVG